MFGKKPPREYTREQFEEWVDAAEAAAAERYGFRPETPLRDNAMFRYLLHRAAHGRARRRAMNSFEWTLLSPVHALLGVGTGAPFWPSLVGPIPDDLAAEGIDPAHLADGAVGFLLIPDGRAAGPLNASPWSTPLLAAACGALCALPYYFAEHVFAKMPTRLGLDWNTARLAIEASLPILAFVATLRLVVATRNQRDAADHARWTAAAAFLATARARAWLHAKRGARDPVLRSMATGLPAGCSRPALAGTSLAARAQTRAIRALALVLGLAVIAFVGDAPTWDDKGLPWLGAWWGVVAGIAIAFPLALAEERRFNRLAHPEGLAIEAADAWRRAALERKAAEASRHAAMARGGRRETS